MLDEAAAIEGTKGIMMIFDDWDKGMDDFRDYVQPKMECRKERLMAAE